MTSWWSSATLLQFCCSFADSCGNFAALSARESLICDQILLLSQKFSFIYRKLEKNVFKIVSI